MRLAVTVKADFLFRMRILFAILFAVTLASRAEDFSGVVLAQIPSMPQGGGYSASSSAHEALAAAARSENEGIRIAASRATPSYCSGATYLVFLKTLGELQRRGTILLDRGQWAALLPGNAADGEGVWGRWNANGPGTARLFHELGIGKNFTSFEAAKPGDFMKIFWTDAVGRDERGHSVIYLGAEDVDGRRHVRFWSSNKPGGYGEKSVSREKIARAIFSRLEFPERLSSVSTLAHRDAYLAGLLSKKSSFEEAARVCGVR